MGGGESSWGSLGRWPCLRHSLLISAQNRWHWIGAWALGPLWVNSPWYPPQSGGSYGSLGPRPWLGEPFSDFLPKTVVLLGFMSPAFNIMREIMHGLCAPNARSPLQASCRNVFGNGCTPSGIELLGLLWATLWPCALCADYARPMREALSTHVSERFSREGLLKLGFGFEVFLRGVAELRLWSGGFPERCC